MPSPHTQSSGEERQQNHNSNIKQRRNPAKVKLKRGGKKPQTSIVIIITNLFLLPRLKEGKIGDSHLQELCISYMGSSNFRLVF